MTPQELLQCMPFAGARVTIYAAGLTVTMDQYQINTPRRQAAFLAQICHESGSLRYVRELDDGMHFTKYEMRKDLGNDQPGDGAKYCGRGFGQVTGRSNYALCGASLGLNLVSEPELLEQPIPACMSAGWFWQRNGLATHADQNNFGTITRIWNGGYNGLDDRIHHYLRIRGVLGLKGE